MKLRTNPLCARTPFSSRERSDLIGSLRTLCQREKHFACKKLGGSAVRRWRSPRALHFRTTAPSAHNLPLQGDNALFSLHKRKKCQKRSVPTCRWIAPPQKLPSKKIPTSPHAKIFGANGVPQRGYGFPHLGIFPHQVRWAEPKFYHAHCAPRAVWAQTGLVRGSISLAYVPSPSRSVTPPP